MSSKTSCINRSGAFACKCLYIMRCWKLHALLQKFTYTALLQSYVNIFEEVWLIQIIVTNEKVDKIYERNMLSVIVLSFMVISPALHEQQ